MTKQKIAIFDIDGTFFRSGLYREILFELIEQDKIPQGMKDIFSSHQMDWKIRKSDESFSVFNDKIVEAFHESLKYMDIKDYEAAAKKVVKEKGDFCYKYTKNLAKKLKEEGYYLITISGSFDEIVQDFAKLHGFDLAIGTIYERGHNNKFTGKILRESWYKKDQILKDSLDWDKFTMKDSFAVGDTAGDSEILSIVDNPIAFNPDKNLLDLAKKNNWKIVAECKNVIYELESKNREYILK